MAWAQAQRNTTATGGGGGGSNVAFNRITQVITSAWTIGSLSFALSPVGTGLQATSVIVNFMQKQLIFGDDYTITGNNVIIQFQDDPANYGGSATFQITYAYNT